MTKSQAMKIVCVLFGSFPNARFTDQNFESYSEGIIDLDARTCGVAVQRLVATSKFLPSIAEIREAATAQQHGARKTGAEAYEDLLEAVQRHGGTPAVRWVKGELRMQSPWPPLEPDVAAAMRQTWGSWADCCHAPDSQEMADRARFIAAYDGLSERGRQDLVAGIALPAPRSAPARALRDVSAPTVPLARSASPSPLHVPAIAIPRPAVPTPFQRRMTREELDAELARTAGGGR